MAITYAAGPGSVVTTFAANETLGSQTQQTGNNTVVLSNVITSAPPGNGQIGTKYGTYVNRLVVINLGTGSEQRRMCISQVTGTGTTRILTVHEDWATNPIATDTVHVAYDIDDVETGGAGGGIALNAKTGLYELTNILTVQSGGGLQNSFGQALELDDRGGSIGAFVLSGGYFYSGYVSGTTPVNGGIFTSYNNTGGEPNWQFQSGSVGRFNDAVVWGQLVSQQFECAAGSNVTFRGTKLISNTDELHLYGSTLVDASASGRKLTTDIVRINSSTTITGLTLSNVQYLDSVADTTTETLTTEGALFSGVAGFVNMRNNKTWNMIDPNWAVTTYSQLTWTGSTANVLNDRRSVKATVQTAAGTKLQNSLVIVYENTQLADLVLELVTDSDGYASGSYVYLAHATNSSTTTYGGHALRVDKWLYSPFAATQTTTDSFNGTVTLILDNNIVQTTQSTALTNGSGITWNSETNPSSIIEYTAGTGTLSVGSTVTQATSGATGVVTKIVDGNSAAGTVHLSARNASAFASTYGLTATGWSATYTASSQKDFSKWIDANAKTLQVTYDYLAALTSETTLSATGELIHEWGRDSQTRALYSDADGFFTERSYSLGVFVTNYDSGTINYFTADDGSTFTPTVTVDLSVTVVDSSNRPIVTVQCAIYKTSDDTELMNEDTETVSTGAFVTGVKYTIVNVGDTDFTLIGAASNTVGVAFTATGLGGGTTGTATNGTATQSYTYLADTDVYVRVRKSTSGNTRYISNSTTGTITSSGFSTKITMREETIT